MSFSFVKTMTVRREVTFKQPRDGTGYDDVKAFITFEVLPDDKKETPSYDKDFFKRVVKNIEGVQNPDTKQEIPFSPEFLAEFVTVQWIMAGLIREYVGLTYAAGRGN